MKQSEYLRRLEAALEQLQITHLRARAPQYLSGGEKKQISIADVLAMEPRLLLLDEPAASLDPRHRRIFEKTLTMLESWGMSLMVSTHDVDFAWRWAERVLVFRSGELAADMPPENLFRDRELLEGCGLEQPVLFRAGEALGLEPLPRTLEEFETAARLLAGTAKREEGT